jgi:hypothetical protein
MSFIVDRDRFLLLAAALAASTCTEGRPASAPPRADPTVTIAEQPEALEESEEPLIVEESLEQAATLRSSCDNDVGEVDCSAIARHEIGPSCEGLTGSCNLLRDGYGFKRRVGEAAARCWEGLGRRACNIMERKRCNREAVLSACPDPRFEPQCQATLDRCKAARSRISYTLAECVQVMSGLDDANREWAIGAMGPAAEGCRLMFPVY